MRENCLNGHPYGWSDPPPRVMGASQASMSQQAAAARVHRTRSRGPERAPQVTEAWDSTR